MRRWGSSRRIRREKQVVDTGARASLPTDDGDDDIVLCSRPVS
jgi:hypothetical protein